MYVYNSIYLFSRLFNIAISHVSTQRFTGSPSWDFNMKLVIGAGSDPQYQQLAGYARPWMSSLAEDSL